MKPIERLKSILNKEYKDEDGYKYKIELFEGLTDIEVEELKKKLPNNFLPIEIEELLRFAKGFNFSGLEDIEFDAINYFGYEEVFPNAIQLASDGFGNYWILDISNSGEWKEVYFACHDPT
ncbi:MAG: SMI1/KNR4 family protein, partial [Saprospiraceae bacterium]